MLRRNFLQGISILPGVHLVNPFAKDSASQVEKNDREYWLNMLLKISTPVLTSLSNQRLKMEMPVETKEGGDSRKKVSHLEAFGRTLAGVAPWLENVSGHDTEEYKRKKFLDLSHASIANAVDPTSKDVLNFTEGTQPLVDAAFLAHALIRAPKELWGRLDKKNQALLIAALKSTRVIKPYYSNWLLFTAMIEAALLKFAGEYDPVRIDYAVRQHETWYKGDGVYGDGPEFHFDYYNSFVIHPMMLDVLRTVVQQTGTYEKELELATKRAQRYAEIQERLISPEGTFPPVGRSIAYRCGAFQLLAQMSLQKKLTSSLPPGQVRSAMTAMIRKTMDAPETFDANGWLTIGFAGHQPSIGESYISTGSLYLCTSAFLPLGLPASDEFWTSPTQPWTSKKAFNGDDFPIDKAF